MHRGISPCAELKGLYGSATTKTPSTLDTIDESGTGLKTRIGEEISMEFRLLREGELLLMVPM